MSVNTDKNWVYYISGRNIHLYQVSNRGAVTELAGYKIRSLDASVGRFLMYPDEDIDDGLMFEGTAYIEPFVDVDPNELDGAANPTLTEQTYLLGTLNEDSHVNLNRMLSLAVVDYIRALIHELAGELDKKEYYMKEFWKKVGDNESNKKMFSLISTANPYAVR
tara:strand:- start:410 stop:901 length:492 start_codon:yes stop_codon:yes gene_type:complete